MGFTARLLAQPRAMGWISAIRPQPGVVGDLGAWGVTFLTAVCVSQGAPSWDCLTRIMLSPLGVSPVSRRDIGNETTRWAGDASAPRNEYAGALSLSPEGARARRQ